MGPTLLWNNEIVRGSSKIKELEAPSLLGHLKSVQRTLSKLDITVCSILLSVVKSTTEIVLGMERYETLCNLRRKHLQCMALQIK